MQTKTIEASHDEHEIVYILQISGYIRIKTYIGHIENRRSLGVAF